MDDDLDAFFDDVDNAVKEVEETSNEDRTAPRADEPAAGAEERDGEQRPPKRLKATAAPPAPARSVVASSVPVVSIAPPLPAGPAPSAAAPRSVPPPPPPLPSAAVDPPPPPRPAVDRAGNGKPHARSAAGATWSDPTLAQWPPDDFRLFVGNLAKDLKEHHLEEHFGRYASFAMARIMYNKADGKSRGYGFVSVLDPKDCARAIREMDQSWLGSRPIKVKLSEWKDRELGEVRKKGRAEKRRKKKGHF